MAVPAGIKLDDGTGYFVSKCFPARNILGRSDDGAWLVAQRIEQKKRLQAVLGTKESKTYSQIKHERRLKENPDEEKKDNITSGLLDGFFLLHHCCVDDPNDVSHVNVAAQDLTDAIEEDFELFQNVVFINAGENLLHFKWFKGFQNLQQLELPLNGLRGLNFSFADFPLLQSLDLSYNNLSKDDVLALGVLPKLTMLHLSGNQLRSLPVEMQTPHQVHTSESENILMQRFGLLEDLSLDDNQLSDLTTFSSLAGLRRLKRLNLEKNFIQAVPHLKAVSGRHIAVENEAKSDTSTPQKRRSKSARSRSKTPGSASHKSVRVASDSKIQLNEIEESLKNDLRLDSDILGEGGGGEEGLQSFPPPFPELEYLNLAHNEIAYEENLLAVAAWPMLARLDIYANPLTMHNKGDPPLLKRYLVDRLGITMRRKRPVSAGKPAIQVAQMPGRKVEEVARPLPKRPLQLMLKPSPDKPAVLAPKDETPSPRIRPTSQPLPPISPSLDVRPKTDPGGRFEEEEEAMQLDSEREKKKLSEETCAEEPVFLTQVNDDQDEEMALHEVDDATHDPAEEAEPSRKEKPVRVDQYPAEVPDKFKGYEVFWDAPDDPEVVVQKDIQSNMRSLKIAVQHRPVYRSDVDLDRLQKPFQPHQKTKFPPRPPQKTKAEKLEDVLEEIKNRVMVTEENLASILEDKNRMRREYPEVPALLKEIQMKYKAVRAESMIEKRQLAEVKDELVIAAGELKSSIHTQSSKPTTFR